jgi:hypothetical protein
MNTRDRQQVLKAMRLLSQNPQDYDGAMAILAALAGVKHGTLPDGPGIDAQEVLARMNAVANRIQRGEPAKPLLPINMRP